MANVFRSLRMATLLAICAFGVFTACGCASVKPMALSPTAESLDLTATSVGLLTLRTSNQLKPSYEPQVTAIEVTMPEADQKETFRVGPPHQKQKKEFYEYLISLDLVPGTYTLGRVSGQSPKLLTAGTFRFPIDATFDLPANSVVYLGHIEMVNRKRKEGEPRSGSVIPLIDQAASGYAEGTFDITISDRSSEDISLFKQAYPVLENRIIMKKIVRRNETVVK